MKNIYFLTSSDMGDKRPPFFQNNKLISGITYHLGPFHIGVDHQMKNFLLCAGLKFSVLNEKFEILMILKFLNRIYTVLSGVIFPSILINCLVTYLVFR